MKKKSKRDFKFPIKVKAAILIIVLAIIMLEASMAFFSVVTSNNNKKHYKRIGDNLAATAAEVVDAKKFFDLKAKVKETVDTSSIRPTSEEWGSDAFYTYTHQFDKYLTDPDYISLRDSFRRLVSANAGIVDCFYLVYVDKAYEQFIYVVDSAPDTDIDSYCHPGCIDPLYETNRGVLTNDELGFPAYITDTESYGYLVTAGAPVHYEGQVIGYAVVDIPMAVVRKTQANNIITLFFYLLIVAFLIIVIGLLVVHFVFSRPLKKLAEAARLYDTKDPHKAHETFEQLNINTHDEISELADSMKRMERDINVRVQELVLKNEELIESQNKTKQMAVLANKDGLTGVQNKVAYNTAVDKINKQIDEMKTINFGVAMVDLNYLKETNDAFGHDAGDEALIKLSGIICEIFKHSPVYRIGGDEFVIILRGRDYKESEELIRLFNDNIVEKIDKKHLLKEGISAAIGYAEFDPDIDKSVDDVFKRADKAMYDRKRKMKKIRDLREK